MKRIRQLLPILIVLMVAAGCIKSHIINDKDRVSVAIGDGSGPRVTYDRDGVIKPKDSTAIFNRKAEVDKDDSVSRLIKLMSAQTDMQIQLMKAVSDTAKASAEAAWIRKHGPVGQDYYGVGSEPNGASYNSGPLQKGYFRNSSNEWVKIAFNGKEHEICPSQAWDDSAPPRQYPVWIYYLTHKSGKVLDTKLCTLTIDNKGDEYNNDMNRVPGGGYDWYFNVERR